MERFVPPPTPYMCEVYFTDAQMVSSVLCMSQDNVSSLLPVFEEFLKNAPQDASYDSVRQSVVILMGSLAKHLDKNDPKVKPIVAKLITALSTPSQQVRKTKTNYLTLLNSYRVSLWNHSLMSLHPGSGVCSQLFASTSACN